jgi:hypothetical protein
MVVTRKNIKRTASTPPTANTDVGVGEQVERQTHHHQRQPVGNDESLDRDAEWLVLRLVQPEPGHHHQHDHREQGRGHDGQRHRIVQEPQFEAEHHGLEQDHGLEYRQQQDTRRQVVVEDPDHGIPWGRAGLAQRP